MAGSFGELLRRFRVAASLTQEALAERCGLSPATIAAIEQGRRNAPRLTTVRMIAEALELTPADRAVLATAASYGATAAPAAPAPAAPAVARGALPTPITPLFGRVAEADLVAHELASERLVTLVGTGGVGKTRLALEVASAMLGKFPGGTFWTELGPVSEPDGVQTAVLHSLGAAEQPRVPVREQILAALPAEPALLVIDNCEHVLDAAAALVAELLVWRSVTVLATSREPLALPGEVRWMVPALAVPGPGVPLTADELASIDSVQLFAERASRAVPRFTISDADAGDIARVCRRLEGIPLAIELAAARMGTLAPAQLAGELDEQMPLAATAARGVPGRQATLWASINWSYRLLTPTEQAAFRCLACFAGPFTAAAFAAVSDQAAAAGPAPPAGTLYRLAEKSLVTIDGRTDRYRVLDTIRGFAAERAGEASALTAIHDAHAGYYASWLTGLGAEDASDEVLDLIEAEYANVRAAVTWSIETRSARAATMVAAMGVAWQERALYRDAAALGDAALEIVEDSDPGAWARAVRSLAMARLLGGDIGFLRAVSRAEEIAAAAGDSLTVGWCRLARGSRPPFDGALLASAHEIGAAGSGSILPALGAIFLAYGGTEEHREELLRRGAEFSDRSGNATARAASQIAWADSLVERGHLAEAADLAVPAAFDTRVMPTLRLLGIGRTMQVALYRRDEDLAELAGAMITDLAHVWPVGASWLTSSWTAFGGLLQLWSALLRGERAPAPNRETLRRVTRMALTPGTVRIICRAAIDHGDRVQPNDVALGAGPPAAGSLMAASFAAVEAAHATIDGDDAFAQRRWSDALSVAARCDYLLLVCDALEGLGCLAGRRGEAARAAQLFAAARQCRDDITYRHRFTFEQELLDQAAAAPGAPAAGPSSPWQSAIDLALLR
jgi:predicted ATPase/transcriptional regulator with XRE-family HTH domain